MNYEKEYKEFSKWWEELTDKNPNWKTLERLAAKDAWMEATKRAEVNGAETNREQELHKHIVNRWAYLFDNWQPIMLGIAIALAFNVIVTMFENVIVKIALIIHGG